jgi:hypothetical protein
MGYYTTNLSPRQNEILNKEFKVNSGFNITRGEFEGFPCPMVACNWSDKRMEELAEEINKNFYPSVANTPSELEELEDEFYSVMENTAVRMGMKYYGDLTESQEREIEDYWNSVKYYNVKKGK